MKIANFCTALLLVTSVFTANANNDVANEEKEVQVSINDALVPSTVKANENVKAVISGLFPNGCYKFSRSEVSKSPNNNILSVATYARVSPGMCIMVLVPYTREVELGSLQSGEYRVRFVNGDETYMEKRLVVE